MRLLPPTALRLGEGNSLGLRVGNETLSYMSERTQRTCLRLVICRMVVMQARGEVRTFFLAVNLIPNEEQESKLLGGVFHHLQPFTAGHGRPAREALRLQLIKVRGLLGAMDKILPQRTVHNAEQHRPLGVDRWSLVGLPAEDLKSRFID